MASALRAEGHRVFTATQTGLGERDVVLVGHSFGGSAISGVADWMPEAVRHLVHPDSLMIEPGKKALSARRRPTWSPRAAS